MNIKIDCSAEHKAWKRAVQLKEQYEGHLLGARIVDAVYESNGRSAEAYQISETPILYVYAEALRQIADVPAEMLDTHSEFNDTEEAITIKRYVVRRVAGILHAGNRIKSTKISYAWSSRRDGPEKGLFHALGYQPEKTDVWRDKKRKISKIVRATLKLLKDRGYISGFLEYRKADSNNPALPVIGFKICMLADAQ